MFRLCRWLTAFPFAAAISAAPAGTDAGALLAKSATAFERNQTNQKHWNWTITETRKLVDKVGASVVPFPSVTSESIIRSDGRRCNAVTAWGDGREPYLKNADSDERCQAYNAIGTPFDVAALLKSATSKLVSQSTSTITILVTPDKSKTKASDYAVRCAASIKATIELDSVSYFPRSIDGQVVEGGCDSTFVPVVHYGPASRTPLSSQFRKGATFRVEYTLQNDKFGNPGNSFWISSLQHYSNPWKIEATLLYYWGREFRVVRSPNAHRLVKDIRTTAQEFGAGSQLRFDK